MKIYIHIITRWTQRWATLMPSSSIYYYNKIGSQVLSNTCCHNIIGPYIIYFKVDEELADAHDHLRDVQSRTALQVFYQRNKTDLQRCKRDLLTRAVPHCSSELPSGQQQMAALQVFYCKDERDLLRSKRDLLTQAGHMAAELEVQAGKVRGYQDFHHRMRRGLAVKAHILKSTMYMYSIVPVHSGGNWALTFDNVV